MQTKYIKLNYLSGYNGLMIEIISVFTYETKNRIIKCRIKIFEFQTQINL